MHTPINTLNIIMTFDNHILDKELLHRLGDNYTATGYTLIQADGYEGFKALGKDKVQGAHAMAMRIYDNQS